jgi:hypothetical protein
MLKSWKMEKTIILLFLVFMSGSLIAQPLIPEKSGQTSNRPEILQQQGVSQDPQIERLVGLHIQKNEATKGIQGFRVEIFFSSALDARQKALTTKAAFLRDYPEVNVYVIYISPDFKVRVGDFRTKNEALALMKKVQDRFPKAFIVPDIIEFPILN